MAAFDPGTLWKTVQQTSTAALHSGALQPIPTHFETVHEAGITFLVRIVDNLAHKQQQPPQIGHADATGSSRPNPFRPYDHDLFVADASDTHVCLLNKYSVVDHHLLIVTREFEDQQQPLNLQDFTALWRCMAEYPALAFYNAGTLAGASQPHKHLQMVPLPLAAGSPAVPVEPLVDALPFRHAVTPFAADVEMSPDRAAHMILRLYDKLLQDVGVTTASAESDKHPGPYNLLLTRRWMMLVPRTCEAFHNISINALGFAGALLVQDEQQYDILKQHGPLTALKHVTQPAPPSPDTATQSGQA